jgi:radical SAM protein with 4Fe4S-binding SPASM domain
MTGNGPPFLLDDDRIVSRAGETFPLRLVSWNVTWACNLGCAHCYIDAGERRGTPELSTDEGKRLIDQIAATGSPILVLSGGEPLLRKDLYELVRHGCTRGMRMALGTNGTLIDDAVAGALARAGLLKAAISLDSVTPETHDRFRGAPGAWDRAIAGIRACRKAGIGVQIHTTVTTENCHELDAIFDFGEELGVRDYQVFFLVPTGRGRDVTDVTGRTYESLIRRILLRLARSDLSIRPTCAPQFMRIAAQQGVRKPEWRQGCIAGRSYCRVTPDGEVTPCPYLPLGVGNVRDSSFGAIWHGAPVLRLLRAPGALRGKCGRCEYTGVCGGCRARAFGLTGGTHSGCGRSGGPLEGDYLAEDPWCPHEPGVQEGGS